MSKNVLKLDQGCRIAAPAKFLKVIAPATKGPQCFTLLSERARGMMVARFRGFTQPIPDGPFLPGCEPGSQRWEGYLHAVDFGSPRTEFIVRITAGIGDELTRRIDLGFAIQYLRVKFFRKGTACNGELLMQIGEPAYDSSRLPQPVEVLPYLERMYSPTVLRQGLHDGPIHDKISDAM